MVLVKTECFRCKKEIELEKGQYNAKKKINFEGRMYCSSKCHNEQRNEDQYTIMKCNECEKEVRIRRNRLTSKLKRSKSGKVFCSVKCSKKEKHKKSLIEINCFECGMKFTINKCEVNQNKKRGSVGNFCSRRCSDVHRNKVNTKYKEKYKEIICDYCGKVKTISIYNYNRAVKRNKTGKFYCSIECVGSVKPSEETRKNMGIANTKRNYKPFNLHLIHDCMKFLGEDKYSATIGLIPDAVYTENDKLIAVECQRSDWKNTHLEKIKKYDTIPNNYDEVHIFWLDPRKNDKISAHYHKKDGKWNEIPIENLNITV